MAVSPSRSPSASSASSVKGKAKATDQEIDLTAPEHSNTPEEEMKLDGDEDDDEEVLIATIAEAKMTGLPNYRGAATLKTGAALELRRDHVNVSDKNAIEVRYANKGTKIGMVQKSLAVKLAPLVDNRLIETECVAGEVPSNIHGVQSLPFSIKIFGTRSLASDPRLDFAFPEREAAAAEKKRLEEEAMKAAAMERKASAASESSLTPAGPADLLMAQSILIEKSGRSGGDFLGELFKEGGIDPATLPIHPCPPGKKDKTMRTDLMTFQKQGLAWMIKMEHPELPRSVDDPPTQLWCMKKDTEGETFWFNVATETSQRQKPVLKRGGILADEMGLGKTMQTIALICTDDTGEGVLDEPEEPDERYDDMTLIVCPLSVASNWTDQFHRHVGTKRMNWHLYHGEGRDVSKKELRKFDVVITTYQTLALEHIMENKDGEPATKKAKLSKTNQKEGTLHTIKWRRVVLDEGHLIKNPKAKMSISCADLKAERRWILTGTPIVNSITDLGAMMTFLKLCRPLDQQDQWARCVEGQLGGDEGGKLLRAVVSSTTLRRTKDMTDASGEPLVALPPVQFYLHKVKLSQEAQQIYDEVFNGLKTVVGKIVNSRSLGAQMSHVLIWLLRLRQLACDPSLCPQSFIDSVRSQVLMREVEREFTKGPSLGRGEVAKLQVEMQAMKENNTPCGICYDQPLDPRITPCGHLFCAQCIEECIALSKQCPLDGRPLKKTQLIQEDVEDDEEEVLKQQARDGVRAATGAAKTQQLIMLLKATEPGIKSLVFSQWTTHLNCIEAALEEAGIVTCRFDGSMSQSRREDIIASFSAPPPKPTKGKPKKGEKGPPSVMLISLKAGALGLNLTCASQVFLMDPWWQASIEQQAIDRVNRIGQQRGVKVFQLVADGTLEDRVLEIQKKKEELISQAFSGNKAAAAKKEKIESRLQDITAIFGL